RPIIAVAYAFHAEVADSALAGGGSLTLPFFGTVASDSFALALTNTVGLAIYGEGDVGVTGRGNTDGIGVSGSASGDGIGVSGFSSGIGVSGLGDSTGVLGRGATGVEGRGTSVGIYGTSQSGDGVVGESITGLAGHFVGNVGVEGQVDIGSYGATRGIYYQDAGG